jgi:hypothetical protein
MRENLKSVSRIVFDFYVEIEGRFQVLDQETNVVEEI